MPTTDGKLELKSKTSVAQTGSQLVNFCHIQCLLDKNENSKCILER
jgi:hypothetical protein